MSEIKNYTFSHKELAEILVKVQDLHEGFWGVYIEFGLGAANVTQPISDDLVPAAIIPIKKIGIQRFDQPNNLTVDAAHVNPSKSKTQKQAKGVTKAPTT